jgi:hypothetical protein
VVVGEPFGGRRLKRSTSRFKNFVILSPAIHLCCLRALLCLTVVGRDLVYFSNHVPIGSFGLFLLSSHGGVCFLLFFQWFVSLFVFFVPRFLI